MHNRPMKTANDSDNALGAAPITRAHGASYTSSVSALAINCGGEEEKDPASLGDLAPEIMIQIFGYLIARRDIASAASLGLACSSFYGILKVVHPASMPLLNLDSPTQTRIQKVDAELYNVVKSFLGPNYRGIWAGYITPKRYPWYHQDFRFGRRSWHFLNKEVFFGENKKPLAEFKLRMQDYAQEQFFDETGRLVPLLPAPMGKGDSWYHEIAALRDNTDTNGWPLDKLWAWNRYFNIGADDHLKKCDGRSEKQRLVKASRDLSKTSKDHRYAPFLIKEDDMSDVQHRNFELFWSMVRDNKEKQWRENIRIWREREKVRKGIATLDPAKEMSNRLDNVQR